MANRVILSGRWTKDVIPETKGEAMMVARGTLAVDRRGVKRDAEVTADFISCVAFGKTAEFIGQYAGKQGQKIIVEGRIQTGSYTNKDGQKVYTTDVVVENVEFADSKKADTTGTPAPAPAPAAAPGFAPAQPQGIPQGFQQAPQAAPQFQQQPVYGQPAYGQPAYGQPAYGQPMTPPQAMPVDGMPSFN